MQAENVGELAGLVYLAMHDMIPGTTYAKSASDRMGIVIRKMEEAEYHLLRGFLYEAIFVPEGAAVPPEVIVDSAELQVYYVGVQAVQETGARRQDSDSKKLPQIGV